MKVIEFLHNDFSIKNNLKLRRIKLSICSVLLIFSFTIIGYKTFSLASITKVNKNQIRGGVIYINARLLPTLWPPKAGASSPGF